MTILITGSAGFLGRHFVDHHLRLGHEVYGIDDLSNAERPTDQMKDPNYYFIEDDAGEFLLSAEGTYSRGYHFAAPVGGRLKIEGDPLFNADSLRLDSQFFRWAITHVGTVVYPSSSAVYGTALQGKDGIPLKESHFKPSDHQWFAPDEMYGFTKMAGEVLAYKASQYGLRTLCLRPFSGYGEGQSLQYPVPAIAQRALNQEDPLIVWGSGHQRRDFVHISDLVGATEAFLDQGLTKGYETLNIGSGFPVSFVSVAEVLADLVGYSPTIETDPTKPEGVLTRWADTQKLSTVYQLKVPLRDGLRRVLEDVDAHHRR
jgi:UDP-glucose 4-epimerase